MGWNGKSKEFKNIKKKKEIIANKTLLEEYLEFIKIENNYIYFKINDEEHDLLENNKTYQLIFRVKMFSEYTSNRHYTFREIHDKIDFDYNKMKLIRTSWSR